MKAVKSLKLTLDNIRTGPIYVSWVYKEFHWMFHVFVYLFYKDAERTTEHKQGINGWWWITNCKTHLKQRLLSTLRCYSGSYHMWIRKNHEKLGQNSQYLGWGLNTLPLAYATKQTRYLWGNFLGKKVCYEDYKYKQIVLGPKINFKWMTQLQRAVLRTDIKNLKSALNAQSRCRYKLN